MNRTAEEGFTPPEGVRIFNRSEAQKLLRFSFQSLYDKVEEGRLPAYYWGDHFTKLLPRTAPEEKRSSNTLVFLESDVLAYNEQFPFMEGSEPVIDDEVKAQLEHEGLHQMQEWGAVSYREMFAEVRRKFRREKKKKIHNTVILPEIMRMIDLYKWPLIEEEKQEVDALLEYGRGLLKEHGHVRRQSLMQFMYERFGTSTRFYQIIAYIANREGWPIPKHYSGRSRRAGVRHKPKRRTKLGA